MKIFIHVNNNLKYKVADLDPKTKIGFLVKEFASELVSNQDYIEDVEVYIRNKKDDLDKGKSLKEVRIEEGSHLFVGRCKTVDVIINYAGQEYTVNVPSSTPARRIRKTALEHFCIAEDDGVDLLLWLDQATYLEDRNLIGSTTDYPECATKLLLASKEDVQGNPEEEVLAGHLNSPEFLSGELDKSWGLVKSEGPKWPFYVFWIQAKNGIKYHFRFDLTGYNQNAPTALLWNIETQAPLDPVEWPNWNKRAKQVFRLWGKQCLYLPIDRLALQGHNDWHQKHAYLMWKSLEDSITKYLLELYQILNY
ncbi:hypothetical protein QQ020_26085 [Fulvivirgaceae bacterium BMA12]|uniref:Uncharacterized protein n=1 Tax=Agaribacillus aureus TaxID=3051825 RepID=A0ABT8LCR8_9BACT|nr:hypothetical protein [Fulvivirgaceae bacterium BMA12]